MGRRIVITGVTGFIGRSLTECFLKAGDDVYGIVRPDSPHRGELPMHENFHPVFADLSGLPLAAPAIGKADVFIHLAWGGVNRKEIDEEAVHMKNAACALESVRLAARLGCALYMDAGSRQEYGRAEGIMAEDSPCLPITSYGKAKLIVYESAVPLCGQLGLSYCHLRFFSVYGYGDHPWSFVSTLVRELTRDQEVSLSACRHQWNFMYIKDAARAVAELCTHFLSVPVCREVVNVAGRDTRPLRSFAEEIHEMAGGKGSLSYGTFLQGKEGALDVRPDISRLIRLTGFKEAYSFREGIAEMMRLQGKPLGRETTL